MWKLNCYSPQSRDWINWFRTLWMIWHIRFQEDWIWTIKHIFLIDCEYKRYLTYKCKCWKGTNSLSLQTQLRLRGNKQVFLEKNGTNTNFHTFCIKFTCFKYLSSEHLYILNMWKMYCKIRLLCISYCWKLCCAVAEMYKNYSIQCLWRPLVSANHSPPLHVLLCRK